MAIIVILAVQKRRPGACKQMTLHIGLIKWLIDWINGRDNGTLWYNKLNLSSILRRCLLKKETMDWVGNEKYIGKGDEINFIFVKRLLNCLSVCPSVRPHGTTRLPLGGFSWNLIFEDFFLKSVEKIQVPLKSDKNNGYFTWRPIYIFDHISLSSS